MANDCRIPRTIEEFNGYIIYTASYLDEETPTNATRLGIDESEVEKWTKLCNRWTPLFIKYKEKKGKRTTTIKDQLLEIIDDSLKFNQDYHFLDRIAASLNVTIVDLETFNIKKGVLQKDTRTLSLSAITEPVVASIKPIGGGSFSVKCHHSSSTRASIFDEADSVQYIYFVGTEPPASPLVVGLTKEISTKASFTLALGADNSAKYLYIYFRWYLTKYPNLPGPWSGMLLSLIL